MIEYEKLFYIDLDCVFIRNIDNIFNIHYDSYLGTYDYGKYTNLTSNKMNGGVFLMIPNIIVYNNMLIVMNNNSTLYLSKEAEQGFFNYYFKKSHHCCLNYTYNTQKSVSKYYPNLFNLSLINILHYVGEKPWTSWSSMKYRSNFYDNSNSNNNNNNNNNNNQNNNNINDNIYNNINNNYHKIINLLKRHDSWDAHEYDILHNNWKILYLTAKANELRNIQYLYIISNTNTNHANMKDEINSNDNSNENVNNLSDMININRNSHSLLQYLNQQWKIYLQFTSKIYYFIDSNDNNTNSQLSTSTSTSIPLNDVKIKASSRSMISLASTMNDSSWEIYQYLFYSKHNTNAIKSINSHVNINSHSNNQIQSHLYTQTQSQSQFYTNPQTNSHSIITPNNKQIHILPVVTSSILLSKSIPSIVSININYKHNINDNNLTYNYYEEFISKLKHIIILNQISHHIHQNSKRKRNRTKPMVSIDQSTIATITTTKESLTNTIKKDIKMNENEKINKTKIIEEIIDKYSININMNSIDNIQSQYISVVDIIHNNNNNNNNNNNEEDNESSIDWTKINLSNQLNLQIINHFKTQIQSQTNIQTQTHVQTQSHTKETIYFWSGEYYTNFYLQTELYSNKFWIYLKSHILFELPNNIYMNDKYYPKYINNFIIKSYIFELFINDLNQLLLSITNSCMNEKDSYMNNDNNSNKSMNSYNFLYNNNIKYNKKTNKNKSNNNNKKCMCFNGLISSFKSQFNYWKTNEITHCFEHISLVYWFVWLQNYEINMIYAVDHIVLLQNKQLNKNNRKHLRQRK